MNENKSESDIFWTEYSPTPRVGETYGRYKVVKKMVETNCSILMMAKDLRDDSDMVLKFVKYKKSHKDKYDNEIKIMKLFDNPHILKYEYSLFQPPYLIIATKFAPYGNISDFMKKYYPYGIPESIVRKIMCQVLSAVNCLHKQGIWHRDIKPQNFLVFQRDPDIQIKLADFGFAKQFKAKEKGNEFIGTLSYSAPEILLKESYTNAIDIWSIGITMFVLLVNRSPFNEFSFHNPVRDQIISGKLNFVSLNLSHISDKAIEMIRKMCIINPYRRPTTEELLKDEWMLEDNNCKDNEDKKAVKKRPKV